MNSLNLLSAKRFLRRPSLILAELAGIAVAGVVGAMVPQAGAGGGAEFDRLRETGSSAAIIDLFALDHVFQSAWFLAWILLATASLLIVVGEQIRRLRTTWIQRLTEAHFNTAPWRAEFERPAGLPSEDGDANARVEIRTYRRIGLAGSPIFHAGLLMVIVAAALRALFSVEAAADLIEGETLPPTAEAWAAQWPGLLAAPFRFGQPVRLDAVRATRYEGGDLQDLRVQLSIERTGSAETREVAINRELRASGGRLFLGSDFGPAAMLEWTNRSTSSTREAILLAGRGKGRYEGESTGPDGMRAYLQTQFGRDGEWPSSVEVRVMKGGALHHVGTMRTGERAVLPGGRALVLHGVATWARLRGSRDPGLWLAYFGFALLLVGATMIFTMIKVDTCINVTPAGEKERVVVALRPHRFAPLFEERFHRLVRDQGGTV